MKRHISTIQCVLIFIFLPVMLKAQVSLIPTSVFISDTKGLESFYIYNNTDSRQEVSISFQFEYPGSDDEGNVKMIKNDSIKAANHDLAPYLRAFPGRLIMQPNTQQTIIFQVRGMADKPDGTYWTRVVVTSNVVAEDIETVNLAEGVGTKIDYIFKQNIPVFYKIGTVTTGIEVLDLETARGNPGLQATARLLPSGNSPYIGSVSAYLRNPNGQLMAEKNTTVVVYDEALRRIEIPFHDEEVPPGDYQLELVFQTRRRDIVQQKLVQADPVWHTVPLRIE
jgi:hypothetical protein